MEYVARWQRKMDVATSVARDTVVPYVMARCIAKEHQRLLDIQEQKRLAKELKIRHFGMLVLLRVYTFMLCALLGLFFFSCWLCFFFESMKTI